MLRFAVIALLLLNMAYYSWIQGAFSSLGLAPSDEREPRRVEQQINPDALQLRPPTSSTSANHPPTGSTPTEQPAPNHTDNAQARPPLIGPVVCWQVGVFEASQEAALRAAASQHLPEGSWTLEPTPIPSRWMVYMGRLTDKEVLAQKRNELRRLKIDFAPPGAQWEPGLSLGRFPTEDAAKQELDKLTRQGVRTARVVQERGDTPGLTLRLPQADVALRNKLRNLGAVLASKQAKECDTQG